MVSAFINAQAGQRIAANDRIRNHAFHGELHCEIRARFHQRAVLDLFEVADIAGMMVIHFLLELVACENGLVSVDNNDMVAAIGIGRKGRLVLAAQQNGGLGGYAAHRLACCIKHIPIAGDVARLRHIG